MFIRIDPNEYPEIVVECGWSESFARLRADKNLWLKGNPKVQIVILLKWAKTSGGSVKGNVEVWTRGDLGDLVVRELVSMLESRFYYLKLISGV